MGKLKQMMIAALEDYEEDAEYEFYMMMEEEQRKQKEQMKKSAQEKADKPN